MISFFNVRTGETRKVTTEPMLAAYWNSSDQGPNSHGGQDFGWRLAPETLARMRQVRADRGLMDHIKVSFQLADDPKDIDILRWVSLEDARKEAETEQVRESDYTRQYEDEVRALEQENRVANDPNPSQPAGASQTVPRADERKVEDMVAEQKEQEAAKSNDTDSASKPNNGKISASKTSKEDK